MHVQQHIWWIIRAFKKTTEMQETLTWWCVTTTLAWCPCPMWPCGSWSEPGHISQNAYAVRNAFTAACDQTYEVERWLKSATKEIGQCRTRLELQVCFFEASETFRLGQHKLGANSWLGRTCANDSRPFGCFILLPKFLTRVSSNVHALTSFSSAKSSKEATGHTFVITGNLKTVPWARKSMTWFTRSHTKENTTLGAVRSFSWVTLFEGEPWSMPSKTNIYPVVQLEFWTLNEKRNKKLYTPKNQHGPWECCAKRFSFRILEPFLKDGGFPWPAVWSS